MKNILSCLSIYIFSLLLFSACSSGTQKQYSKKLSSNLISEAEAKMQNYIDEGKLVGFSTLVMQDGKIVQRATLGFAHKEANKPMAENTIFRLFSMTKPVTAVALMTLFDEGKLELDDKVSKYIPEYANIKVYAPHESGFRLETQENEMTIRHLLTHTSGISYGWDNHSYVDSLYRVKQVSGWGSTLEEKMLLLADLPLNFQPGTKWKYGLSIDVAGYLVEVISGMPLDWYLKTKIFDPLKMEDCGFHVPEEKLSRFCDLYNADKNGRVKMAKGMWSEAFKKPATLFSGGGGLVGTVEDYARFCQMLLNGGELEGVRVLSEEAVKLIMTDQLPETAKYKNGKAGYGLGGAVEFDSGEYSWAGMASTNFWINPKSKMIIITCTQILPSNYTFGNEFKKMVEEAQVK